MNLTNLTNICLSIAIIESIWSISHKGLCSANLMKLREKKRPWDLTHFTQHTFNRRNGHCWFCVQNRKSYSLESVAKIKEDWLPITKLKSSMTKTHNRPSVLFFSSNYSFSSLLPLHSTFFWHFLSRRVRVSNLNMSTVAKRHKNRSNGNASMFVPFINECQSASWNIT